MATRFLISTHISCSGPWTIYFCGFWSLDQDSCCTVCSELPVLRHFTAVTCIPSASDAQQVQRWGAQGLTLGLYVQRQQNQYLFPKDRCEAAGVPKYSQLLWSEAVLMGESQNSQKWGHALMQLLETRGSEKDKEMTSIANGTFKDILWIFPAQNNEEQRFASEYSSKESAVITYKRKKKPLKLQGSAVLS